jgi:hypothetical protein
MFSMPKICHLALVAALVMVSHSLPSKANATSPDNGTKRGFGWSLKYGVSARDGIVIEDVTFGGRYVIKK